MANTEINEGRGFPLAEEGEAPVAIAPHRILLLRIIRRALRGEHGVRMRQAQGKQTHFYAGKRAAAIHDAAELMEVLYGGDREAARKALTEAVRMAGEAVPTRNLLEADTSEALSRTIAEKVLRVI